MSDIIYKVWFKDGTYTLVKAESEEAAKQLARMLYECQVKYAELYA